MGLYVKVTGCFASRKVVVLLSWFYMGILDGDSHSCAVLFIAGLHVLSVHVFCFFVSPSSPRR